MGNKGTDADHVRPNLFDEEHIICKVFHRLVGQSHHASHAHLVIELPEPLEALCPFAEGPTGAQGRIEVRVGCFVPEQVAVRPCLTEGLVVFTGPLPYGQCDG